jgi:ribose transport system ATP-binding protein
VPVDRLANGIFPSLRTGHQMDLTRLAGSMPLWIRRRAERRDVAVSCRTVGLDAERFDAPIRQLSGGNQQKAVVARALRAAPRVLLAHEPTAGVDVAARAAIHALLRDIAATGVAVLLASSDTGEVAAVADRVIVLRRGRVAYAGEPPDGNAIAELTMGAA